METEPHRDQPSPYQAQDDEHGNWGGGNSIVSRILRRCRPLKEQQQQSNEGSSGFQRISILEDAEKPTMESLIGSEERGERFSDNNVNNVDCIGSGACAASESSESDNLVTQNNAPEEDTERKTNAEGSASQKQQSEQKSSKGKKTREQIFLANEAAARKRAEKHWTVDNEAYDFKRVLLHYTNVDKRIKPKDMKYVVDHREKSICDQYGKVMRTVIRGAIHPLIDNVVNGFCQRMGMSEAKRVPTVEERMFLWFNREKALKLMMRMGPKKQVYFVNFITWDNMLTDLQSLNSRLSHCNMRLGQIYPDHYCYDEEKIKEVFHAKVNVKSDTPMPKMLFVEKQSICEHVFESQDLNKACEEKGCPNFGKKMCRCFRLGIFMPETMVLATKTQFESVLRNFVEDRYINHRWLIRASNLKSGNGVQFIDSAAELETFLRYDIRKSVRGQFYIMQRYLKNPMLMGMRRFDCRMFLLICVLSERRVVGFLHPGYMRVAQQDFDPKSKDLRCHLTWPFTWDPEYNRYKGKNPEKLPDYCHAYSSACTKLELPKLDYKTFDQELLAGNHFIAKLNCIVQEIVRNMESIIYDKPGTWQLFGLDLTVDSDKNPWLYDVMTYPSVNEPDFFSETQNKILPAVFTEAVCIGFELNQRDFATRSRMEWMDLPDVPFNKQGIITAQQNFIWMYSTSPERLLSYKEVRKIPRLHWYHKWRVAEDFNDYILYLKNFRLDSIVRMEDNNIYGRKTFDNSPMFKAKQQLKKSGKEPPQ